MRDTGWINKFSDNLFEAVLELKNLDESRRFFRDLLTEEEIKEFANRWQVAQMLSEKVPYVKIENRTGMSTTTIARISKWLSNGMDGYRLIIDRMTKKHHNLAKAG